MSEETPSTIGRYQVRREIGRGSMGVVYEAQDPDLDRRVALKTISLAFAVAPEHREQFEERFFTEARIAARLNHPGIVVVHDVGRDDATGALYIVLEHLEGQTLSSFAAEGVPLPWREALRLVRAVVLALHYAHSQRVVHRDIKPANIMVLPSGQPKIMDFGIAKIETARLKLTMQGQFFGTPLYMSPEQVLGHKLDHRIDIFASGAILYQLLTGQLAFGGPNLTKIVSRVVMEDPVPPSYVIPTLTPELDYVVARALAKNPQDRYPTAGAFAEDMEDLLADRPPRHRDGWAPSARSGELPEIPAVPGAPILADETDLDLALDSLTPAPEPRVPLDVEDELSRLVPEAPPTAPVAATAEPLPRTAPVTARSAEVRAAPAAPSVRSTARSAPAPAHAASRVVEASRPGVPRWAMGAGLALVLAIGVLAYALIGDRGSGTAPSAPPTIPGASPPTDSLPAARLSPRAETPLATAPAPPVAERSEEWISSAGSAAGMARLEIDFEHSLKSGELRVWIDDELVLEEPLDSRVTKKVLAYKKRKGSVEEALQVRPGKRTLTVRVAWDDNVKTRQISGTFLPDATRRLAAKLGGFLKKDLSLEWE